MNLDDLDDVDSDLAPASLSSVTRSQMPATTTTTVAERGSDSIALAHSMCVNGDRDAGRGLLQGFSRRDGIEEGNMPPSDASSATDHSTADSWMSTLHLAAEHGNLRVVRLLLSHRTFEVDERDSDGLTPLIYATIRGHADVVRALLEAGADPACPASESGRYRGRAPLHIAVQHRREGILQSLLRACSDSAIDAYDCDGRTPLHVAIEADFEAGVQALLRAGANPNMWARKHLT